MHAQAGMHARTHTGTRTQDKEQKNILANNWLIESDQNCETLESFNKADQSSLRSIGQV